MVDVQRVEQPCAARSSASPLRKLVLAPEASAPARRPSGSSPWRVSLSPVEPEPVDDIRRRPPTTRSRSKSGEAASPNQLCRTAWRSTTVFFSRSTSDELMGVVAAGGDQRVPAVGQGQDVQRQVGALRPARPPARRSSRWAARTRPSRPGIARRLLGLEGGRKGENGREDQEGKSSRHRKNLTLMQVGRSVGKSVPCVR